jgi:hypothetical protein
MNDEREGEERRGLKVNDRRRFDIEGNERSDESPAPLAGSVGARPVPVTATNHPPQTPRPENAGSGPAAAARVSDRGPVPPRSAEEMEARARRVGKPELQGGGGAINFSSFVISLATQALMQLGEMPPPDGVALEPDIEAARQTIEILGLIEEKTKGNLEPEEVQLLSEVLHSVRICFVRRSKGE